MRKIGILVAAAVFVAGGNRYSAQQPPPPKAGPEHEHFKLYEGTWDASIKEADSESKGVASWKVGLGGRWLLDHFKTEFGGMTFEGMGALTYDPAKKKYVGVWIDSMATRPMHFEGDYDKSKKTMTTVGTSSGPDGKDMKMTMVSRMIDADNMTFTMTTAGPDGKDFEAMKISYKRRAK